MTGAATNPDEALAALVARRRLQPVPPGPEQAAAVLAQARSHLASARLLADTDPEGAYALGYDAARKALVALLEARGYRATTRGGHIAVLEAASALLGSEHATILRPVDRIRRRRHQAEYPSRDAPRVTAEDVTEDAERVDAVVALVDRLLATER